MRWVAVQFDSKWEAVADNLAGVQHLFANQLFCSKGAAMEPTLVLLPEMVASGFSMHPVLFAERKAGEISECFAWLARRYSTQILAGVAQQEANQQFYNRAVWFDERGRLKASYSKQKLFRYANEHHVYRPGKASSVVKVVDDLHAALLICYDLRFPELFRTVAKEVQLVVIIANWPQTRQGHWRALLQARAIENQLYVLGVNRIGQDAKGLAYAGESLLFGPEGEPLLDAQQKNWCEFWLEPSEMVARVNALRQRFPVLEDF